MKLFLTLVASLIVIIGLATPIVANADVNNFTITNFQADYYLNRADRQGAMSVRERIDVHFNNYNHGLLRALPQTYKGEPLHLHVDSVTSDSRAPVIFTTYTSNGNSVLKIGDASRTVTGDQEYTISYRYSNVITFYNDHDELYWDVNGDQWQQPFTHVEATFHLPGNIQLSSSKSQCYVGAYGATNQQCTVAVHSDTVTTSAASLGDKETLTAVIGFSKGYFQPSTVWDHLTDYKNAILGLSIPPLLAGFIGFSWWYRRGRDAPGRGTIIPEYTPPLDVSPLAAGTIINFKAENREITATIIDLARRGYLVITEYDHKKRLRKDTQTYSVRLTNNDFTELSSFETQLLVALFTEIKIDSETDLSKPRTELYAAAVSIRKATDADLTQRGYFTCNPYKYSFKWGSFFLGGIFLLYFIGNVSDEGNGWPVVIGLIVGGITLAGFIRQLPSRTAKGVSAREQLLGLKLYMETAEKDRLEKLEGPKAVYANNLNEPARTVELFEKLLPYAIVLGVETQWAAQFRDIYTAAPDWYSGNWTAFNVGYFASNLSSHFANAVNSSFTSPSNSSTSGFGGGFSGGGGGGGGGGGW